jgi:uncharacterized membrane protein YfcA
MHSPDLSLLVLLFGVAVIAACFDAIAGGGGLLTVPSLILAGMDPVSAIATNKLQGSAGTLSSTYAFARHGLIDWRKALPIAILAGLAAIAGALSVSLVPKPVLAGLVPLVLVAIALYFALAPRMGEDDARQRLAPALFNAAVVPVVGFYDGVFGPGAGSFYMVGFISLLGYGVVRATAYTKLANAASNIGGLMLFAATGVIVWPVGLVMALGAVLGAQIGSRLALKLGARIIRPLIVIMCCLMALRLLNDAQNPLVRALIALVS